MGMTSAAQGYKIDNTGRYTVDILVLCNNLLAVKGGTLFIDALGRVGHVVSAITNFLHNGKGALSQNGSGELITV